MAAVAMLSSAACGTAYEKPAEGSSTGFALSFFKEVNRNVKPGENVVVSPYSAGVVLSMLAEGAEGETRVEFDNALNGCLFKAEELADRAGNRNLPDGAHGKGLTWFHFKIPLLLKTGEQCSP